MQICEITWVKKGKRDTMSTKPHIITQDPTLSKKTQYSGYHSSLSCDFTNSYLQLTIFNLNDKG